MYILMQPLNYLFVNPFCNGVDNHNSKSNNYEKSYYMHHIGHHNRTNNLLPRIPCQSKDVYRHYKIQVYRKIAPRLNKTSSLLVSA